MMNADIGGEIDVHYIGLFLLYPAIGAFCQLLGSIVAFLAGKYLQE